MIACNMLSNLLEGRYINYTYKQSLIDICTERLTYLRLCEKSRKILQLIKIKVVKCFMRRERRKSGIT